MFISVYILCVYFRISGCMIKKTVASRIILGLYKHCKCFEETAQVTTLSELYHISRKSNFASFVVKCNIATGLRLRKTVFGDL